jgi:hypothetical protein
MMTQSGRFCGRNHIRSRLTGPPGLKVVAALVCLVVPIGATASPVTYSLEGVTATFAPSEVDTLTGTFTFDPSGPTLDSVDILVAGTGFGPGTYESNTPEPQPAGLELILTPPTLSESVEQLQISFLNPLTTSSDQVVQVGFETVLAGGSTRNVTGEAVSVAVPAPLLGSGLSSLALGFLLLAHRLIRRCPAA